MKTTDALDRILIEHCMAGQREAWAELFRLCQPLMLRQIALWFRPRNCRELIEEIAGRVWLKLIDKKFARLAKFDSSRGIKLTTYLVALAKNEFRMFLREEKRRQARESHRAHMLATSVTQELPGIEIEEFLTSLEDAEKASVAANLGATSLAEPPLKLSRRSLRKIKECLGLGYHDVWPLEEKTREVG
jgi:DNA-directed RNA polymerase specialized sigma24 family protein